MADDIRPAVRPAGTAPLRPQARRGAPVEVAASDRLRPVARPEGLQLVEPVEVAAAATVEDVLPLDRAVLIGLFAGPGGRTALLRLDTGAVVRAGPGDVIDGAVVTAIAEDGLRLWRDGRERVLTLPA